jgi:alpha-glucosidase
MYVVYESPLQMLCDAPSRYMEEPEAMEFLSAVPTTWDETHAINGQVGEYVTVARRRGTEWYVGSMSNWSARTLPLSFEFLPPGTYDATIFRDGANADKHGSDFAVERRSITQTDTVMLRLAPGGGWVARISETHHPPD